jgi:uncharacterized protein YneF (UPF0154 family)
MEFVISLLVGMAIGFLAFGIYVVYLTTKIKKEAAIAEEQIREYASSIIERLIFLKIEELPEGMFAYDAVTGDYVCQGKDFDELNLNFGKRYPNKKGVMVKPEEGEAHDLHSIQSSKP